MNKSITLSEQYCPECNNQVSPKRNAFGASLAVDGISKKRNHVPENNFGSCARTQKTQPISSMTIDFGKLFVIYNVTTFGNNDSGWNFILNKEHCV